MKITRNETNIKSGHRDPSEELLPGTKDISTNAGIIGTQDMK